MPLTRPAPLHAFAAPVLVVLSSLAAALAVLLASTRARADEPCATVRRQPVAIRVEPSPFDPSLARRVTEQLIHELPPADGDPCPSESNAATARASVVVSWLDATHARVVASVKTPTKDYQATREIDLEAIPDDGRPLALGIAADEMLDELNGLGNAEPAEKKKPVVIVVAPPAPPPLRPPPEKLLPAMGAAFTLTHLSSGLTLLGPDARLALPLGDNLDAIARVGLRYAALAEVPRDELKLASAWVGGAAVRVRTSSIARVGLFASLGADAIFLPIAVPRSPLGSTAVAELGLGAWEVIAKNLRLTAEVTLGLPIVPVRAENAVGKSVTVLSGVGLGAGFGILASF